MNIRCLCAMITMAVIPSLPLVAGEDFQMEATRLPGATAAGTSAPPLEMVSVTIASASSVTVNPCIGGNRGCPDPTSGYASIPFPAAVLPVGGDAVVSWMFQDLSYSGPVEMTVAFIQNGTVVGTPTHSHSNPAVAAGDEYLVHFATVVPTEAAAGPAAVLVSVNYGGTVTRASQQFTVSAPPASDLTGLDASAPGVQMVSVTIAELSSVTVNPCMTGELGCPDPTPSYAAIPFPVAVVELSTNACVTWMFQSVSYAGPVEIVVAFLQNGSVVGQPSHFTGIGIQANAVYLMDDGPQVPLEALPGPGTVVVSLNYGGKITQASQSFTFE